MPNQNCNVLITTRTVTVRQYTLIKQLFTSISRFLFIGNIVSPNHRFKCHYLCTGSCLHTHGVVGQLLPLSWVAKHCMHQHISCKTCIYFKCFTLNFWTIISHRHSEKFALASWSNVSLPFYPYMLCKKWQCLTQIILLWPQLTPWYFHLTISIPSSKRN